MHHEMPMFLLLWRSPRIFNARVDGRLARQRIGAMHLADVKYAHYVAHPSGSPFIACAHGVHAYGVLTVSLCSTFSTGASAAEAVGC